LGQGQSNTTAIGAGVQTTRAKQFAIGNTQGTYTLAGIGSAQSFAAQNGPVGVVTADASGNLAVSNFDFSRFDAIGARVEVLEGQVASLDRNTRETRRDARQGVAAAIAMASRVDESQHA
jgi:hypothetical protein